MGTDPGCSYVASAAINHVDSSIVLSRNSVLRRNWISGNVEPAINSTRSFCRTTRTSAMATSSSCVNSGTDVEQLRPQLDFARLLFGIRKRRRLQPTVGLEGDFLAADFLPVGPAPPVRRFSKTTVAGISGMPLDSTRTVDVVGIAFEDDGAGLDALDGGVPRPLFRACSEGDERDPLLRGEAGRLDRRFAHVRLAVADQQDSGDRLAPIGEDRLPHRRPNGRRLAVDRHSGCGCRARSRGGCPGLGSFRFRLPRSGHPPRRLSPSSAVRVRQRIVVDRADQPFGEGMDMHKPVTAGFELFEAGPRSSSRSACSSGVNLRRSRMPSGRPRASARAWPVFLRLPGVAEAHRPRIDPSSTIRFDCSCSTWLKISIGSNSITATAARTPGESSRTAAARWAGDSAASIR